MGRDPGILGLIPLRWSRLVHSMRQLVNFEEPPHSHVTRKSAFLFCFVLFCFLFSLNYLILLQDSFELVDRLG